MESFFLQNKFVNNITLGFELESRNIARETLTPVLRYTCFGQKKMLTKIKPALTRHHRCTLTFASLCTLYNNCLTLSVCPLAMPFLVILCPITLSLFLAPFFISGEESSGQKYFNCENSDHRVEEGDVFYFKKWVIACLWEEGGGGGGLAA